MRRIDFSSIRERWVREASESDLGLWWLANDIREVLGEATPEDDVRRTTLEALKPLLRLGVLRAVDLLEGGKFEQWSGDVAQQLARIESEWKQVGRPDIGDVVWFIGERPAARAERRG